MIKKLLNGILKMATKVIGVVLTPINALVSNLFPGMANAISQFNRFLNIGGRIEKK